MKRENVIEFITELLQEEYQLPENTDILEFNYIEEGYIDSMGLLRFFTMIMDEFGIELDVEEMLSPEIRVVKNLVDLVMRKLEA